MHLTTWEAWACIVSAGLAVLGLLGSYFQVRPVRKELTNNGGSSAKDAIGRIEHKVDKLSDVVTGHLISSAAKEAEQDQRLKTLEAV